MYIERWGRCCTRREVCVLRSLHMHAAGGFGKLCLKQLGANTQHATY